MQKYEKSSDYLRIFRIIIIFAIGIGGKIPSHRCIGLLFRTYRKDLGNLVWNSSI